MVHEKRKKIAIKMHGVYANFFSEGERMLNVEYETDPGLDIDLGNSCSKTAYSWAKKSFQHHRAKLGSPQKGLDGSFSNLLNFGNTQIAIASDGIGTKTEIAERCQIYDTLGFDLLAMVADDLICIGAEPTNISNILDVNRLDQATINSLMEGLYKASAASGMSITGGEIAELGPRISGYGQGMHFNWCATAIGTMDRGKQPINGVDIKPGDQMIALKSQGFRSNGFSFIRKIMEENFGDEWHQAPYNEDVSWGEILLTPSLIYTPAIVALLKQGLPIKGLAHITGGGIPHNLARVLKTSGCGAEIHKPFPPHPFMLKMQELGELDDATAYRIWNMGNGMLMIVNPKDADEICLGLKTLKISCQVAGVITEDPSIKIKGLKI